ncbi:MAG: 3-ketoacyl-ACP reductase [Saprospiraceae bacterium]|nr:3-ketoacyl-ACP reductase [Saprospiraceae bacterium]
MARNALITGGSRGIGLGIAEALAKDGFDLAINGMRPEDAVEDVLSQLRSFGSDVIYVPGNIGDGEARKQMVSNTVEHFGKINVLVNNAGVAPLQRLDILETTEESYDRVMDINLKGAFFLSQSVANHMLSVKQQMDNGFAIINVSSISATIASISRGEYCISKAGMSMVTQLFATRLGEENIPVFEVRPGVIATDMTGSVKEKYDRLFADGLAVQKRWGYPEDVGRAVVALSRGDFAYSTGQVIMVDGGLTIQRL